MTYTYDNEKQELIMTEPKSVAMSLDLLLKRKAGHEAKILVEQEALAKTEALIAVATKLGFTELNVAEVVEEGVVEAV